MNQLWLDSNRGFQIVFVGYFSSLYQKRTERYYIFDNSKTLINLWNNRWNLELATKDICNFMGSCSSWKVLSRLLLWNWERLFPSSSFKFLPFHTVTFRINRISCFWSGSQNCYKTCRVWILSGVRAEPKRNSRIKGTDLYNCYFQKQSREERNHVIVG